MNALDAPAVFIPQALDAASSALADLANGCDLRPDDLLAGAIALEWIADHSDAEHPAAVRLARIVATRYTLRILARDPGGTLLRGDALRASGAVLAALRQNYPVQAHA